MKTVRSLFFLAVLVSLFAACHSDDDEVGNWKKVESFGGLGRVGAFAFTIGDRAYVGTGVDQYANELKDVWSCTQTGNDIIWKKMSDFPGKARYGAVGFSDGKYGYVGLGFAPNVGRQEGGAEGVKEYFSDFWKYDPETDSWSQLADFPGTPRQYALGFYVPNSAGNGKGYVAFGYYSLGENRVGAMKDWWQYDIQANKWTELAELFGEKRAGGCVAVIGETAYIFTGADGNTYPNDVIKFTPNAEVKFAKLDPLKDTDYQSYDNDYGMIPRGYAVAFTVGKEEDKTARIYLATGARGSVLSDCWEFNPYRLENGMGYWDEVTSFPSGHYCQGAVAFTLNGTGYVTTGGSNFEANQNSIVTYTYSCLFQPGVDDDDQDDD